MATIIFDFDDTLFDTKKLKKLIFSKISEYGVKEEIIENSYKEVWSVWEEYSLEKHIFLLNKKNYIKIPNEIFKWFNKIKFSNLLFPETIYVLEKLSQKHNLILLTKGEKDFQNTKIKKTGIKKYFKKIYITRGSKGSILRKINLSGKVYFVNDKENENKEIKKYFTNIGIIEKKKGQPIKLPL